MIFIGNKLLLNSNLFQFCPQGGIEIHIFDARRGFSRTALLWWSFLFLVMIKSIRSRQVTIWTSHNQQWQKHQVPGIQTCVKLTVDNGWWLTPSETEPRRLPGMLVINLVQKCVLATCGSLNSSDLIRNMKDHDTGVDDLKTTFIWQLIQTCAASAATWIIQYCLSLILMALNIMVNASNRCPLDSQTFRNCLSSQQHEMEKGRCRSEEVVILPYIYNPHNTRGEWQHWSRPCDMVTWL